MAVFKAEVSREVNGPQPGASQAGGFRLEQALSGGRVRAVVLVSHRGGDHHLNLRRGDRLVRIDGRHPIDWAWSLVSVHLEQPATSSHSTFAELLRDRRR